MKRTPLSRRTPLRATSTLQPGHSRLARTGSLRPVSSKRAKRDAVYSDRRNQAAERDGWTCRAVEVAADNDKSIAFLLASAFCSGRAEQTHHIAGRGGPDPHRLSNLLTVCGACHRFITENPLAAVSAGLSASRHGGAA